ncbi:MAG: spore germination protein GerW family protein [Saprospiraceae bacterium]|nr:spore germination protein GerW family protein [Saprospiraceae bacterium]
MEVKFKELLDEIIHFMETEATTKTVVGESFKLGQFDCVPVIRVGMGFGSGGGERDVAKNEHDEGMGAGAGMGVEPIGFLVTKGEDIQFISSKQNSGLAMAFEKAPELLQKYFEGRKMEAASN